MYLAVVLLFLVVVDAAAAAAAAAAVAMIRAQSHQRMYKMAGTINLLLYPKPLGPRIHAWHPPGAWPDVGLGKPESTVQCSGRYMSWVGSREPCAFSTFEGGGNMFPQ